MAFLLKVFSGSERLKEKQKSADLVNETFQAELNDVQTKLEVENYELQMLVEMIYDSSYPESQKFLKQPSKDRLYAHKETISSLLFGLAAQGVSVAPLILMHFQKHGCDAIADTLLTLLNLVRPLVASKDVPEFTSDDILDAIDVQWHSSVRSSPAFASLRGSTTASPLQSPRVSFSSQSPGQSFSNLSPGRSFFSNRSPRKSFSNRSPVSSPGKSSPHRLTQSFRFSPPSEAVLEGAGAAQAPRRSLSSQYPASEVDGEGLQPLVEHDEEISTGLGPSRKQDDEDEACSRAVAPVHSSSLDIVEVREFGKGLSINNIPRSAASFEVEDVNADQSQVADEELRLEYCHEPIDKSVDKVLRQSEGLISGDHEDTAESEAVPLCGVSEKDIVDLPIKSQPHVEDSDQAVGDQSVGMTQVADHIEEPTLIEQSVGDVDKVVCEGFSGGHEDTVKDIEESEVPSYDSSNHEVSEEDNAALPTKNRILVEEDSEQTMNVELELNSSDNPLISKEGKEEGCEDTVGTVKMVDMLAPQETEMQSDEEEVQGSEGSLSGNGDSCESSMLALDQENINIAVIIKDNPHDVPELSSSMESCEHDVQEQLVASGEISHNEGDIIAPSSSSLLQETTPESPDDRSASIHDTEVEESNSSSWTSAKSTSAQSHENAGDSRELEANELMDKAEEVFLGTNNASSNEAVESAKLEDGAVMEGVEIRDGAIAEEDESMESVKEEDVSPSELPARITEDMKEPRYESSSEAPNKEHSVEKTGVGREEFQELSDLRSTALSRTDVLSQSSFSDHYDGEETTESSSDGETSSSGDETDEDDEETMSLDVKKNGRHLSRSSDEDQASIKRSQLDEQHVGAANPELEQYGAALHSPSYNLVTFDLTKLLSRDGDEDIGGDMDELTSCDGLESEGPSTDHALGSMVPFSEQKLATLAPVSLPENGTTELKEHDADLVESGTSSQNVGVPMKQESHGAELFGREFHQRNEPSHDDDSEAFSEFGSKFPGSDDNEVKNSGEKHAQDEEKLAPTIDSTKSEESEAEKGAGAITRTETRSAEDIIEVMASHSQAQDDAEGASSSNQCGLYLAGRGDEISATNQLVSTRISEEDNGGTSDSLDLSSTTDEEDRSSISDQVGTVDEGISSNVAHFADKTEANDLLVHEIFFGRGEGRDFKQVLDGVNNEGPSHCTTQENGICDPTNDLHVDEISRPSEDHDKTQLDKEKDLVVASPSQGDSAQAMKQVRNYGEDSSQENGAFVPTLSESDVKSGRNLAMSAPFLEKDETKKSPTVCTESDETSNGILERDGKNQVENQGSVVKSEQPGVKEQPQSLERLDKDAELVTGSATYGVFLHNTKFLDTRGSFVKALTAPVIIANHVETQLERHSIRDSLICTPASNSDGTHKNGRQRRYSFLRTLCFTCCSRPSAL